MFLFSQNCNIYMQQKSKLEEIREGNVNIRFDKNEVNSAFISRRKSDDDRKVKVKNELKIPHLKVNSSDQVNSQAKTSNRFGSFK